MYQKKSSAKKVSSEKNCIFSLKLELAKPAKGNMIQWLKYQSNGYRNIYNVLDITIKLALRGHFYFVFDL